MRDGLRLIGMLFALMSWVSTVMIAFGLGGILAGVAAMFLYPISAIVVTGMTGLSGPFFWLFLGICVYVLACWGEKTTA